jgi:5'-3' exonuclease
MYKTIALVDFSYVLRRNYHAQANDSGPNGAGEDTLQQLSDWTRKFEHVICCLDSPPYERTKVFPDYKGQRDKSDTEYPRICRWTKERLVTDGYSIAASPGQESDDVMATLANRIAGKYPTTGVMLITADKDACQCIFNQVNVWAPMPGGDFEVRTAAWVDKKWGITPEQVPLLLAIMGDKGDNIPGIAGIGETGAAKLIKTFGAIPAMRKAAAAAVEEAAMPGAKPLSAFWKKFLAGHVDLDKWLSLTTLRTDVPLDLDALLTKRAPKPLVETDMQYDPEDDGREPDWRDIEAKVASEQQQQLLDPAEVISPPKAPAPSASYEPTVTAPVSSPSIQDGGKTADPFEKPSGHGIKERPPKKLPTIETTGIVVSDKPLPPSWALSLQPSSAKEALQIAGTLFNSRYLSHYGTPEGVFSVILRGRELGYGMSAALEMFHIVQNKPYPKAKALKMLAERDPMCEWIMVTSADDKHCTIKTKHRRAGELEYTYTIERAERAGFLRGGNKGNWLSIPQEMLEARATSKAVNRWYPGSTFGMSSAEEMLDQQGAEEQTDE